MEAREAADLDPEYLGLSQKAMARLFGGDRECWQCESGGEETSP